MASINLQFYDLYDNNNALTRANATLATLQIHSVTDWHRAVNMLYVELTGLDCRDDELNW